MPHRSPCVPAYRKFCSAWWIASGSPRSRPRRRWDRGPAIPACILLAYRGSSKRTTSRHSSQLPAVFSAVRPLFQPGLDSPKTIKNTEKIYDSPTFVHSFVRLSHSRLLYLSLFQGWTFRYFSVLNLQRNFRNIFERSSNYRWKSISKRSKGDRGLFLEIEFNYGMKRIDLPDREEPPSTGIAFDVPFSCASLCSTCPRRFPLRPPRSNARSPDRCGTRKGSKGTSTLLNRKRRPASPLDGSVQREERKVWLSRSLKRLWLCLKKKKKRKKNKEKE